MDGYIRTVKTDRSTQHVIQIQSSSLGLCPSCNTHTHTHTYIYIYKHQNTTFLEPGYASVFMQEAPNLLDTLASYS